MDAFGKVLVDSLDEKEGVMHVIERDDNFVDIMSSRTYFRDFDEFDNHEKEILDTLTGKVIDLGAGAGRLSLYLQSKGVDVTAMDSSEGAVEVCRQRGVKSVAQKNMMDLEVVTRADYILIFGNTIPVAGSPQKLVQLLNRLWYCTKDDGRIIGDFYSPLPTTNPINHEYHDNNRRAGKPVGQVKIRIRYKNLVGNWFDFWLPQPEEFLNCVKETKWQVEITGEQPFTFVLTKT